MERQGDVGRGPLVKQLTWWRNGTLFNADKIKVGHNCLRSHETVTKIAIEFGSKLYTKETVHNYSYMNVLHG